MLSTYQPVETFRHKSYTHLPGFLGLVIVGIGSSISLFPGQCGWFKVFYSHQLFLGHPILLVVLQGIIHKKSQLYCTFATRFIKNLFSVQVLQLNCNPSHPDQSWNAMTPLSSSFCTVCPSYGILLHPPALLLLSHSPCSILIALKHRESARFLGTSSLNRTQVREIQTQEIPTRYLDLESEVAEGVERVHNQEFYL